MFDEIPHSEKVFKRHQNSDDPCIMAWDHYSSPKFYEERKISGTSEKLVCLIQHVYILLCIQDLIYHMVIFDFLRSHPILGSYSRICLNFLPSWPSVENKEELRCFVLSMLLHMVEVCSMVISFCYLLHTHI